MRRKSFEEMHCSVAQFLEVGGEWWTMLIVRDAFLGVTRFDDFHERLGISRNVLTQRLEHLIEHGVLERQAYQDKPVRYDYRLTEKGRALWPVLNAMRQWGDTWAAPDGPPLIVTHTTCGRPTTALHICSECGEQLTSHELRAKPGPGARDGLLDGLPPNHTPSA
ncbi:winged helix-turn-helix transcriptional regulator [Embleya sp. NBC_00896]|uniref:winged helix-turn-helix transcriptional regulator n=1 Tax=Embleya sp. NBC_00896 TaxID=2975961 RepID=UPI00386FD368|nr:helix-turn-helix transcriptional regulator [Embleya sp. NBC_00896]